MCYEAKKLNSEKSLEDRASCKTETGDFSWRKILASMLTLELTLFLFLANRSDPAYSVPYDLHRKD